MDLRLPLGSVLPDGLARPHARCPATPHSVLASPQFCTTPCIIVIELPMYALFPCALLLVTLLMLLLDHSSFEGSSRILSLNPLLSCMGAPPLYYDVTRDVRCIQLRPGCPNLLQEPAVDPASTLLVLSIPSLPLWSTIEVRNDYGVRACDVLARIRDVLDRSVSPAELGTMVSISAASEYFRARTLADPREFAQGVKRIDFLGPNVFFAGLSRSRNGQDRWEVHFVPRA
jgi:hypothetical protein